MAAKGPGDDKKKPVPLVCREKVWSGRDKLGVRL